MNTTRELGPTSPPTWHRPFLRYFDGEHGAPGTTPPETPPAGGEEDPPGAEALGDAGKRALDTMKAARNAARDAERKAKADLAALQAQIDGNEAKHQQELEAQRITDEALAAANLRIKKAELRAAATGKLSDPNDAQTFISLDAIEVDDEGNVDRTALDAAVAELLTKKPYLAAQGGSRFQGAADGGARNGDPRPQQLTEADVKKLSAEGRHAEIVKAKEEGRLEDYLKS